jgi:glycosyltransferase involved in cell wall biosynthesis
LDKYFLFVGRLAREKNVECLLQAMAMYQVLTSSPWGLRIVGDGPERSKLETLGRLLGVKDVEFVGTKQYSEIGGVYRGAGALVLPSTREPWGLVVNEALACGLPVLVSQACGCVPDLVRHGECGFTFDPKQPRELAMRMLDISSRREMAEEMGQSGRKLVRKCGLKRYGERCVGHLDRLIECSTGEKAEERMTRFRAARREVRFLRRAMSIWRSSR